VKRIAVAILLAAAAAACSSHHDQPPPDAGMQPPPDAPTPPPDGPPAATFTSFVLDLVQHQTADNTTPVPYAQFQALPDDDGSNGSAYSSLFP
jgi:hypothetical protein